MQQAGPEVPGRPRLFSATATFARSQVQNVIVFGNSSYLAAPIQHVFLKIAETSETGSCA
jgi:hypothetical protein